MAESRFRVVFATLIAPWSWFRSPVCARATSLYRMTLLGRRRASPCWLLMMIVHPSESCGLLNFAFYNLDISYIIVAMGFQHVYFNLSIQNRTRLIYSYRHAASQVVQWAVVHFEYKATAWGVHHQQIRRNDGEHQKAGRLAKCLAWRPAFGRLAIGSSIKHRWWKGWKFQNGIIDFEIWG